MHSIFHFWKHLVRNKKRFVQNESLSEFPFDASILSCKNKGIFPDLAVRLNNDRSVFTGGELIELKDSKTYTISSFNSTIPTGRKNIRKVISSEKSITFLQMKAAGDDVFSVEEREVYYLVRGRRGSHQKICLVHGSFFETIEVEELIRRSFAQVLNDKLLRSNMSKEDHEQLMSIFFEQGDFSRVRNVKDASVKLRFRIMTEVKPEGNVLNSKQYSEIADDTLNFLVPYYGEEEKKEICQKMEMVVGKSGMKKFRVFSLKHPLNGWFVVFQTLL